MAAQITNDITGLTGGKDILNHKITLPVIYALSQADGEIHTQLKNFFIEQSETMPEPAQISQLLLNMGAIHYAAVKLEYYRLYASDFLDKVEKAGVKVEKLRTFLK
jgi:geranylgeranyl pyrophosphate synthase